MNQCELILPSVRVPQIDGSFFLPLLVGTHIISFNFHLQYVRGWLSYVL